MARQIIWAIILLAMPACWASLISVVLYLLGVGSLVDSGFLFDLTLLWAVILLIFAIGFR